MTILIILFAVSNFAWFVALVRSRNTVHNLRKNRLHAELELPHVQRRLKNSEEDHAQSRRELYEEKAGRTEDAAIKDKEIALLRRRLVTDDWETEPTDDDPATNPCAECGSQIPDESADYLCAECRAKVAA